MTLSVPPGQLLTWTKLLTALHGLTAIYRRGMLVKRVERCRGAATHALGLMGPTLRNLDFSHARERVMATPEEALLPLAEALWSEALVAAFDLSKQLAFEPNDQRALAASDLYRDVRTALFCCLEDAESEVILVAVTGSKDVDLDRRFIYYRERQVGA